MEVDGEDGSKFALGTNNKAFFGRGSGFNTDDRTVSRRHLSFQLNDSDPSRVSFKVLGRNPIWVFTTKDATIRIFRKFDEGYLEPGDRFCLSGKSPFWFNLNKKGQVTEPESSESEVNFEQLDLSGIDAVKEFGFLVIGHEFDQYPKGVIRNVKNWEWFLEEPSKESSDEEEEETRRMRRKRKGVKDNEDDEWTGDSEDDKDLVAKMGKGNKPGYSTRSRDKKGSSRDVKANKSSKRKKATSVNETDDEEEEKEDDDDDDETLGGFIVTDEEKDDDEEEEENNEDEEEEFEEDDDDMEED